MAPKRGLKNRAKAVASKVADDADNKNGILKNMNLLAIRSLAGRRRLQKFAKAVEAVASNGEETVSKLCVFKVIDSLAAIGWHELVTIGRFNIPGFLRMTVPPLPVN